MGLLPAARAFKSADFRGGGDPQLVVGVHGLERCHGVLACRALECCSQIMSERIVFGFSQFLDDALPAVVVTHLERITHDPHLSATGTDLRRRQGRNAGDAFEAGDAQEDRWRRRAPGSASFPDPMMCPKDQALRDNLHCLRLRYWVR
jgi:hypothetical protein